MAERIRIQGAAAKIQTAEGSPATPTLASNAIRLLNIPTLQLNNLEEGDRADEQHAGMGTIGFTATAGAWGQVDIMLAIKGGGADYSTGTVKPEWDPFMRAAGFSAVVSGVAGSGKILYADLDGGVYERLTLFLWGGNKHFQLVDCIVLPKWSVEAAKKGIFTFTVIGKVQLAATEVTMGAQTLSTVVPPLFILANFSVGAVATLKCRKTDCDLATVQTSRPGASANDGLDGFEITDREPTASAEIEVVPIATFDPYTRATEARDSNNGIDTKLSYQIGTVQFNRAKFAFGQWAFRRPPFNDNSGLATWPLSGKIIARTLASGRMIEITVD